jgi:hypothetical protein
MVISRSTVKRARLRNADTRKLAGLHAGQSFGLHAFQKKFKIGIKTSRTAILAA